VLNCAFARKALKRDALAGGSNAGTILAFPDVTAVRGKTAPGAAGVHVSTGSEVFMSGRRGHARFAMLRSPEGFLRVRRDVVIQSTTNDHIVAISGEPGVLGESVSIQLSAHEDAHIPARVLESHPIVVDGSVRHQLRLHQVPATSSFRETDTASPGGLVE
jgi:hypothetical protein